MPSRNIIRTDLDHSYYHVYARGIAKASVFADDADKDYFLRLLSRYLARKPFVNKLGYAYPHFRGRIELLSYCLMDNHFHLLFYQVEQGALSELMKGLFAGYVAYFNRRHKRTGPLFESRFKAALISNEAYLAHVSRYIHLNPRYWQRFPYSSIVPIGKRAEPEWLQPEKVLAPFASRSEYLTFVADYEEHKRMMDGAKLELANL